LIIIRESALGLGGSKYNERKMQGRSYLAASEERRKGSRPNLPYGKPAQGGGKGREPRDSIASPREKERAGKGSARIKVSVVSKEEGGTDCVFPTYGDALNLADWETPENGRRPIPSGNCMTEGEKGADLKKT